MNYISMLPFFLKTLLDAMLEEDDGQGFSGTKLLMTFSSIILLVFFTENYLNTSFNASFYGIILLYFSYFTIRNIKARILPRNEASKRLSQFQKEHYKFFKKATLSYPGLLPDGMIQYERIQCFLYKTKSKSPSHYPDFLAIPIKSQQTVDAEYSIWIKQFLKDKLIKQKEQFYFWNDNAYHFKENSPSIKYSFVKHFGHLNVFDESNKEWFNQMFTPKKIIFSTAFYYALRLMWIVFFILLVQFFDWGVFNAVLGATGLSLFARFFISSYEKRKLLSKRKPHHIYPSFLQNAYEIEIKTLNARVLNQITAPIMLSLHVTKKDINSEKTSMLSVFRPDFIQINTQADGKQDLYFIDYNNRQDSQQKPIENRLLKEVLIENDIRLEDLKDEDQLTIEEKLHEKTMPKEVNNE